GAFTQPFAEGAPYRKRELSGAVDGVLARDDPDDVLAIPVSGAQPPAVVPGPRFIAERPKVVSPGHHQRAVHAAAVRCIDDMVDMPEELLVRAGGIVVATAAVIRGVEGQDRPLNHV